MYNQELRDALCVKIERNYEDFVSTWSTLEPATLIQEAEEIAATKMMYDELTSTSYSDEYIKPLLRFENPLEVIRDEWIAVFGFSREPEMMCIFRNITRDRHIERKYALDK